MLTFSFCHKGQFAIEYFHVVYKAPYVVGAAIIACTAVTAALWIFFKLREKWMNQWYKRLGCAMIMAVAVCGKSDKKEMMIQY
jgi:NO-binding membrane sensor protein with MHYT domain